MNPATTAGMSKWFIVALYAIIFLELIVGLGASIGEGVREGSAMPPLKYVGDKTIGADEQIYDSVRFLMDTDAHAAHPDIYTSTYMEYHRNLILKNLFILGILIWLLYKFYANVIGNASTDALPAKIGWMALALGTLMALEFAYVLIDKGNFIVPLHGLGNLVWNVGSIWVTGPGFAPVTEVINQTVNQTAQNVTFGAGV